MTNSFYKTLIRYNLSIYVNPLTPPTEHVLTINIIMFTSYAFGVIVNIHKLMLILIKELNSEQQTQQLLSHSYMSDI